MNWKRIHTLSIVYTQLVDLHNNSTFIVRVHVVSRVTGMYHYMYGGGEISADSGR